MTAQTVFLVMEQPWFSGLVQNQPPRPGYSHDQHLFQFGHESLRKGFDVYVVAAREAKETTPALRVKSFYPVMSFDALPNAPSSPDLVVVVYPQSLGLRKLYPESKIIGILPATIFLENPERPSARWVYGFLMAARTQVDFYLTQNKRMAELAWSFFRFVARVDLKERILVCPFGIVAEQYAKLPDRTVIRSEMGVAPNDIVFINAGGPWAWTDYNTSLRAFCSVARDSMTNIKLFIMGFKQSENLDHDVYISETKKILANNQDLVGSQLIVIDKWREASAKVLQYTSAADVGINANKDSGEAWQSYRLRFLEYMKAGIPVINTIGDYLSMHEAAEAVYPTRAGDVASYATAIRLAATDHALRLEKAKTMQACATHFNSVQTYGRTIDKLCAMPRRDFRLEAKSSSISFLNLPASAPSNWKAEPASYSDFPHSLISFPKVWMDGDAPYSQDLPILKAENNSLALGFILNIQEPITANSPEVLQLGLRPEKSRLIINACAVNEQTYQLSICILDHVGRAQTLVSPTLFIGRAVSCHLCLSRIDGVVHLVLNDNAYQIRIPAWTWIETNQLWLGSRVLPAIIEGVWIKVPLS